jgi:predicted Zn-dependent protease
MSKGTDKSGIQAAARRLAQRGDPNAVLRLLTTRVKSSPDNCMLLKQIANLYIRIGKPQKAERYLVRAAAIKPDDPVTQRMMKEIKKTKRKKGTVRIERRPKTDFSKLAAALAKKAGLP